MQGWGWEKVHHPDYVANVVKKVSECFRTGRAWEDTFPLRGTDGAYRWFLSRAFPIRDAADRGGLWCGTNTDVTEQRETEAELAAAYRREALLNQIGQAVRLAAAPEEVESAALARLAHALGADCCLSIVIDRPRDLVRFVGEWRRPDLPPLVGDYPLSAFAVELAEVFPAGGTLRVSDTQTEPWSSQTASMMAQMRIRALTDVPLSQEREVVGVLGAYMADAPRQWTGEEAALVEAVASQPRATTEAARVRLKERRIATDLQDALQPPLPEHIPGLAVASYVRPTLDEAPVGGDFYDLFSLDKERCTPSSSAMCLGKGWPPPSSSP